MKNTKKKGVTLTELMVVRLIIAIIAAIAVPFFIIYWRIAEVHLRRSDRVRVESKLSLIHQREVGEDITDFASAIRSAQLAGTLKGIVSQCLIPCGGGTARVAATELLVGTDAILNLVREGKAHQIQTRAAGIYHKRRCDRLYQQ